uniref:Uncharacterized protein n=1 Tax=Romanomermis culicivorax TaxID=13658 RepID=A0A915KWC5_ROMCU
MNWKRNNVVNTENMIVSKREWSVLLQAFLICVNVLFTILGFFLVPVFVQNKWVSFLTNLIWITCTGLNALIYIFLNQLIRRKFVELVKGKMDRTMIIIQTGRFVPSHLANSAM